MLWAVPVCSGQYWYALGSTGMLWAVPLLPRSYRYCPEHTGPKNKPVLVRAYRYWPEHTVLSRAYRYCPGVSSSRLTLNFFLRYNFFTEHNFGQFFAIFAIKIWTNSHFCLFLGPFDNHIDKYSQLVLIWAPRLSSTILIKVFLIFFTDWAHRKQEHGPWLIHSKRF